MTTTHRRAPRHLHSDDATHQTGLANELRNIRTRAHWTQTDLAVAMSTTDTHISLLERHTRNDISTHTLHRWAHALNHQINYHLHNIPDPPHETPYTANLLAMAATAPPETAHQYTVSRLIARLAAARRWYGHTLAHIGQHMGATASGVKQLEAETKGPPKLSTLQRYARALGGHLTVNLTLIETAHERASAVPAHEFETAAAR